MLLVKLAQLGNTSPIESTVGVDVAAAMVEITVWVTVTTSPWSVAVVEAVELLEVVELVLVLVVVGVWVEGSAKTVTTGSTVVV